MPDSARYCRFCQGYGDHHTDRNPMAVQDRRVEAYVKAEEAISDLYALLPESAAYELGQALARLSRAWEIAQNNKEI
jgi:hypothetical protein